MMATTVVFQESPIGPRSQVLNTMIEERLAGQAASVAAGEAKDEAIAAKDDAVTARDEAEAQRVLSQAAADDAEAFKIAASGSASAAAANRALTDADVVAAEAARDAAFVNADVYADTAAGLAGTTLGDQFQVIEAGYAVRYKHEAGPTATEVVRYPTKDAIDAEAVRVEASQTLLRRASGMVIPIIGAAMLTAAATQWSDAGDLVGVVRQPDLASAARTYIIPRIGEAVTADFTADGVAVAVLLNGRVFTIPMVGSARVVRMMVSGEFIEASGDAGQIRHATRVIPRIGDAIAASFTPFGDAVGVDMAETPSTSLEQRALAGLVTGRVAPQIHLQRTDAAWVPVTNGPWGAELVEADSASGTATVRRKGKVHPVKWRTAPLGDGATMHLCVIKGQSLAQGFTDTTPATNGAFDRYPAWRDLVGERAWQFKAGDGIQRGPRPFQLAPNYVNRNVVIAPTQLAALEPLRGALHAEDVGFAQTSAESLAAALLSQHLHARDHVLTAIVGTGATPIADFGVGTEHMDSVEAVIAAAATQATVRGMALKVWLVWNQGEQDNANGTLQATYEAAWIAIRDHIEAEAIAAGGTFGGAVIQQCSQRPAGVTGMATLAHAALIADGEAAGVVHYPMLPGHSGAAHLFPETYLPLGSATAWAISRLIEAGSTAPYVATGAATLVNATTIDCVFSNRSGAMQFDTDTIPNDGSYGIRVDVTGGPIDIDAFEWTGAGTLRLTLGSSVVIGDAPVVRFGLSGSSALLPGASGPRVNIRDGSEWPCPITGQIVSGWVLQHEVAVVAP